MAKTTDKEITIRCKAFSSESGPRQHTVTVGSDGTVRVYDSVAGHFTTCHSMSQSAQARARRIAAK